MPGTHLRLFLRHAKVVGRIYKDNIQAGEKWAWLVQATPPGAPTGIQSIGHADTLEEARAALTEQYRKACGELCPGANAKVRHHVRARHRVRTPAIGIVHCRLGVTCRQPVW
jgi:hypothetical protein